MATGAVRVRGLKELTRDFRKMSRDIAGELREELLDAAEPVREIGEQYALGKIRNMPRSPHWAGMRIGVSRAASTVYMVPAARRRSGGRGRPNLANLLMDRAMEPALEAKQGEVVNRVDQMLGRFGGEFGF